MEKPFEPVQKMTIRDLETLKVVSDPLRVQVLELLTPGPHTVRQIAERLGLSPHKLYYHINLLEKHELVKVVETRVVSGIIEKHYQAAARAFEVDHDLLSFSTAEGQHNIHTIVRTMIDSTRDDMMRSLEARAFELEHRAQEHPRRFLINRVLSRLPDERANEFIDRLQELIEQFDSAEEEAGEAATLYALTVALYPSFYYPDENVRDA